MDIWVFDFQFSYRARILPALGNRQLSRCRDTGDSAFDGLHEIVQFSPDRVSVGAVIYTEAERSDNY